MSAQRNDIDVFQINIALEILSDLQRRLENTRWDACSATPDWDAGTNGAFLVELMRYWQHSYDWRKHEAALNQFAHFKTALGGLNIHFIHERGHGPAPLPIILTHGYPDSFFRFTKIIPLLTNPAAHGGQPEDAFDVVAPDLPGYGFSDKPKEPGSLFRVHDWWAQLMTEKLGYKKFAAHGGDWGSTVTEQLARSHADSVIGIHLTDVPFGHLFQKPGDPSSAEAKFLKLAEQWQQKEGAYAMIQSTKPQSLSPALNDSPAGLAAWIVEKFHGWSDCGGKLETRFSKDELLTNIMIYWVNATIGSSFLPYYDFANAGALTWIKEAFKQWTGSAKVPAAFALFPADISRPPREWAERFFNVQRWTEMPRGGHFAALEEPELLVNDIRAFFRPLRANR